MENVSSIKDERKLTKQILSYLSEISLHQIAAFILCFVFTRANFFGVIKPFATSLYVSANFCGISKVFAIISITLGNALFSNFYETVRQALALLLFEAFTCLVYKIGKRNNTIFNRAVIMAALTGFTGIIRGLMQGIRLYDFVISVLCSLLVFSLTVLFEPACDSFQNERPSKVYTGRILFSKAVLLTALIISLKGIQLIGCQLSLVLASLAIIFIARQKGSAQGALAGAFIGMIIAVYESPISLQISGMLALAGAAAGVKVKSKTVCCILWNLVVILFTGLSVLTNNIIFVYYEALAAGILFLVIPNSVSKFFGKELGGVNIDSEGVQLHESGQIHEAADRLFVLSKALSRVSRNIEETVNEDDEEGSGVEWIAEMVAEKICSRCSFSGRCWKLNFMKTYKMVENTITSLKTDKTGHLEIPAWFKSSCTKHIKFFETLEAAYSIYKTESIWRKKINESRLLLAKHASLVSGSVLAAARGLLDTSGRDFELESVLLNTAVNSGLPIMNFRYNRRREIKPLLEAVFEGRSQINTKEIDEIVHQTLSSKFIRVGENRRDMMGYSVVRYMKKPKYKTATGIARLSRKDKGISGDNFAFFISNEGYHISSISDGSGSGRRAERYSRTAIQMLENLAEDGIELAQAIRILNLYLNLRGENERLATMDISAIDLSTGAISFYKYDAAPTFIKRKEGVTVINNENMMDNKRPGHYSTASMKTGDIVIMISDGAIEAFSDNGEISALQWFIESIDTINAQYLADEIINEAINRSNGNHDDITVLATRLW